MTNVYVKTLVLDEPIKTVWNFLTQPEYTKQYMYNSVIVSPWIVGESFSWHGEYMGEKVVTEGTLLEYRPKTHFRFSELKDGILDEIVSYSLEAVDNNQTKVTVVAEYFGDSFADYKNGWDEIVIKNFIQLAHRDPQK